MTFVPSAILLSDARVRVAEQAGVGNDTDWLTRADRAIQAACKHFNNAGDWDFLRTTASDISVISGTSDYSVPNDTSGYPHLIFKRPYDVRLVGGNARILYPMDLRLYDQVDWTQSGGVPCYYTTFTTASAGTIRLIPSPTVNDTLRIKYYRRISIPTTVAQPLDVPEGYEEYLLAWASAFLLATKGQYGDRQAFWLNYANNGLATMKRDQEDNPDREDVILPPPMAPGLQYNPNSVWPYLYES